MNSILEMITSVMVVSSHHGHHTARGDEKVEDGLIVPEEIFVV